MLAGYRVIGCGTDTTGFGSLVPAGVAAVEAIGPVEPDELLAGEAAIVAKAVDTRKLEFARGRSCARRALAVLGIAPAPVLAESNRAPVWPAGVIGSITHCRDYACAVVARVGAWSAIGIDAEIDQPIAPEVQAKILTAAEIARLAPPCVVFSIKEAIYKAWSPRARRWLDFHEVDVVLDVAAGRFVAGLLVEPPAGWPRSIDGRFCIDRGRVLAAAVVS